MLRVYNTKSVKMYYPEHNKTGFLNLINVYKPIPYLKQMREKYVGHNFGVVNAGEVYEEIVRMGRTWSEVHLQDACLFSRWMDE